MSAERTSKKVNWTPEDRARHKAIRDKFQAERPTLAELLASGDYVGPIPHGLFLTIRAALHELKLARESAGLSLADLAERSGIDKASLSRLENGVTENPTVETLMRYATAVGKELTWSLRDLPAKT